MRLVTFPEDLSYEKITATLLGGGYFCVLLPMAYPTPKAVSTRLITATSPSIVNISIPSLPQDSPKGFYMIGGSQSLRRGLTAYRFIMVAPT